MKSRTTTKLLIQKFCFKIFVIIFCSLQAYGQSTIVEGTVKSTEGGVLPGVTIQLKGQPTAATSTDANGKFKLPNVQARSILVFRLIGFETKEIEIFTNNSYEVTLAPSAQTLQEVVAVGYGTVRKKDLTGSVSSVSGKDLQAFPTSTVTQALQGRSAGVQVTQNSGLPGAGMQVRIRGTNSIRGSNEPLWIIDGFPGNQNILNANDVESMEILKDASATAIYGSQGANGVVIVTTKKGKLGATVVEYNGNLTLQTVRKKLDLLDAQEYMRLNNIQQKNDNGANYFSESDISSAQNVDWQDLLLRTAPLNDHNINIYGGNDKTKFSISSGIFDQKGIVINNSFQRINLRGTIDHRISDKVSVSLNTFLSRSTTKNNYPSATGLRGGSLLSAMVGAPPTVGPYAADGKYRLLNGTYPFVSNGLINPIAYANEVSSKWMANRVLTNLDITYKPINDLSIKLGANVTNADTRSDSYTSLLYPGSIGSASIALGNTTEINGSAIVDYTKQLSDNHRISLTLGSTLDQSTYTPVDLSGTGFLSDIYETYNIGSASTLGTPSSGYTKWSMLSFLGRANYSYKGRLLTTFTLRSDGSSRYSPGEKWGYFPSAAVAYRLSEEKFIKDLTFISDLKLRLGYGMSGSTAISPYYTLNMLTSGKAAFNDAVFNSFSPSTRLPDGLKWETTAQTNIGIDIGFSKERYKLSVDYYIKNTSDLLNSVQLPRSLGYVTTIQNVGEIQNKGLEFMLSADLFQDAFKWNLSGNLSLNKNKVSKLYNGQDILGSALNITILNDNLNLIREGQPISVFYGYQEDGYDAAGKIKYKDLNGSGTVTSADKTYIGNPNPKFIYGLNSTMSWKNFDFSFFIQGVQGNDIYSLSMAAQTMDFGQGLNTLKEVLESNWTAANPDAKYPKISRNTTTLMSDRFVYDGSYLRLKTILLAYNFPLKVLGVKTPKNAQVYVSGQNLLTISSYPWYDPEINSYGGENSINQGIDLYAYPVSKSVTFGLKVGF